VNLYFKGRTVCGKRVFHWVIWDGVHDYANEPPLQAFAAQGLPLHLKVGEDAVEDIYDLIHAPMADPEVGGLVVWTEDHRTYRLIVRELSRREVTWLT
jgi:hypothetical protein